MHVILEDIEKMRDLIVEMPLHGKEEMLQKLDEAQAMLNEEDKDKN